MTTLMQITGTILVLCSLYGLFRYAKFIFKTLLVFLIFLSISCEDRLEVENCECVKETYKLDAAMINGTVQLIEVYQSSEVVPCQDEKRTSHSKWIYYIKCK